MFSIKGCHYNYYIAVGQSIVQCKWFSLTEKLIIYLIIWISKIGLWSNHLIWLFTQNKGTKYNFLFKIDQTQFIRQFCREKWVKKSKNCTHPNVFFFVRFSEMWEWNSKFIARSQHTTSIEEYSQWASWLHFTHVMIEWKIIVSRILNVQLVENVACFTKCCQKKLEFQDLVDLVDLVCFSATSARDRVSNKNEFTESPSTEFIPFAKSPSVCALRVFFFLPSTKQQF